MTGNAFRDSSYEVLKELGAEPEQKMEVEEISFKSKIAEGDNIEKFARIIDENRGEEILMMAGTGTGKTYIVNKFMDEVYKKEGLARIELLGVPSTAQARQLAKAGFKVLVEYENIDDWDFLCHSYDRSEKTGHSSLKIVFVYDKAQTVLDFVNRHKRYRFDLFVDEAHKLYTAYNYRSNAIDIVESLIQAVKERNGSVVLMTATPRSLAFRKTIKKVIYCKGAERISKYQKVEIVCKENETDDFKEAVYSTIVSEVKAGNRCFVRYNSFDDTGDISAKLRAIDKLDVKVVSSRNKDYEIGCDDEGNRCNIYKNDIFNCFVNHDSLPDANVWMTTSMLDEGGNIVKIEGAGQPEDITAIFVVKNKMFMQVDDMLQFAARIRFPYKKFIIIVNRTKEMPAGEEKKHEKSEEGKEKKISKMESLTWKLTEQVGITRKILSGYTELMKLQDASDSEITESLIEFTKLQSLAGFKHNMECISIGAKGEIDIAEKKMALTVYNIYNNQYMDKLEGLVRLLKSESECYDIEITDASLVKADFNAKGYLETAIGNDELLEQIYTDWLTEDNLKAIEHTKEYKRVRSLIQLQDSVYGETVRNERKTEDAIVAVCQNETESFRTQILKKLIASIPDEEIKAMCSQNEYKGKYGNERELLKKAELFKLLNGLTTMLGTIDNAVQQLRKQENEMPKLRKYIEANMDGYINELYLEDREKLYYMDKLGRERCIILDIIYEINPSGNMVKKTINKELTETVVDALNKEFGAGTYTSTKVKNRIRKMCNMQDGDKLSSLKKVKR